MLETLLCVGAGLFLVLPFATVLILDWRRQRRGREVFAMISARLKRRIEETQARIDGRDGR